MSATDGPLDEWISQGWDRASDVSEESKREDAAKAYAHFRAFEDIVHRMNFEPERLRIEGETNEAYSAEQRQKFQDRADEWESKFRAKIGDGTRSRGATRSTQAKRSFP
jgi:phytoene/squalene synthetase